MLCCVQQVCRHATRSFKESLIPWMFIIYLSTILHWDWILAPQSCWGLTCLMHCVTNLRDGEKSAWRIGFAPWPEQRRATGLPKASVLPSFAQCIRYYLTNLMKSSSRTLAMEPCNVFSPFLIPRKDSQAWNSCQQDSASKWRNSVETPTP